MATSLIYIAEMPRAEEGANPPSLIFDAVMNMTPTSTARLSKYPISDKSEIANHRIRQNPTLTMKCYMGRAPLTSYQNNLVGNSNPEDRPRQALNVLTKWDEKGTELFIAGEYADYTNYVLTKVTPILSGSDSLGFDLSFEKARRVSYERGDLITNMSPTKKKDAKSLTASGKTDTNAPPPSNVMKILSLIGDIAEGALSDFIGEEEKNSGS